MTKRIKPYHRIITTISKGVISQNAAIRTNHAVGVEESSHLGIVVSRLQVVEPGFGVVVIPAIAERVILSECGCHCACDGKGLAPRVVGVFHDGIAACVADTDDIALYVFLEIIYISVVDEPRHAAGSVVEVVQRLRGRRCGAACTDHVSTNIN